MNKVRLIILCISGLLVSVRPVAATEQVKLPETEYVVTAQAIEPVLGLLLTDEGETPPPRFSVFLPLMNP
jgi:hypothetical protein